ncbi:AAA family ATPase [Idiomarina sp. Sol25]|uniref:AAA family ATPase n=1 Tax=Idiomarina sp. Sol25 TaxID=3064000 RepID=UPI00294AA11A|nr:AAA family ATPase [Idiomarina sp. Sol25]MDV6326890.1 AAA family ATPase [Idiomarina sp. Sol25]
MKQLNKVQLTADSPKLPELPIKVGISDEHTFEYEWIPLSFFWLARCLTLVKKDDARRGMGSWLNELAVLYDLPDNLFEQLVDFSRNNKDWRVRIPEVLGARALQRRLDLSDDEYRCVVFSYLCGNSSLLAAMLDMIYRYFAYCGDFKLLSKIIGVSTMTLDQLNTMKHSLLRKMKIIESPEQFGAEVFRMSKEVSGRIHACQSMEDDVFKGLINYALPETIKLEQFRYLNDELALLKGCVRKTSEGRSEPMSILLVGAPGTGKTKLIKALTEDAEVDLVEVPFKEADSNGDYGKLRLAEFDRISQMLKGAASSHILFDDAGDALRESKFDGRRKAWINRLLEYRHTTAYWICASAQHLDPAFLRRFDCIININEPDFYSRMKLLKKSFNDQNVNSEIIEALAYTDSLTPAKISQLAKLVSRFSDQYLSAEKIIEMNMPQLPQVYSPELGHFDMSVAQLDGTISKDKLERLCKEGSNVSLLINGISGSGKTALARYLCHDCNGSNLFFSAAAIIDCSPEILEDNLTHMFNVAAQTQRLLAIDNFDHVVTAIERLMPSPQSTLHLLTQRIRTAKGPIVITLDNAQSLTQYPTIESAIDLSVQMKAWATTAIRKKVSQWAAVNSFKVPTIDESAKATPRQVIRALRSCLIQENEECLNL